MECRRIALVVMVGDVRLSLCLVVCFQNVCIFRLLRLVWIVRFVVKLCV